jgi:hypothetical protein
MPEDPKNAIESAPQVLGKNKWWLRSVGSAICSKFSTGFYPLQRYKSAMDFFLSSKENSHNILAYLKEMLVNLRTFFLSAHRSDV